MSDVLQELADISILVVDDEPISSMFMGKILAKHGAQVSMAYSGAEALALYQTGSFDIVVTDICMPDMDGLELASAIRRIGRKTHIIAATAVFDTETLIRAIKIGFNDYVTKPVEVETLLWAVRRSRDVIQAERRLTEEQIKFRTVFESLGEGLAIKDLDYRVVYQNPALTRKFGDITGAPCYTMWGLQEPCPECPTSTVVDRGQVYSSVRIHLQGSKEMTIESTVSPLRNAAGAVTGTVEIIRDISERVRTEQLIRNIARGVSAKIGTEYFSSLASYLTEALEMDFAVVGELSQDRSRITTNAFSCKGKLVDGFSYDVSGTPCARAIADGLQVFTDGVTELFPDDLDLQKMAIRSYCGAPLTDSKGIVTGILCTFHRQPITNPELISDIIRIFASRASAEMERIKNEQLMRDMAFRDHLTGLANRRLFEDHLAQSIAKGHRNNSRFGLIYLDLDYFKQINDTWGHEVGDLVLKVTAERIRSCCRRDYDTISRHGGDEFCIIVEDVVTERSLLEMAVALQQNICQPIDTGGGTVQIGASIGVALYPVDGETLMELEMAADRAMYMAKQAGRNTWRFASTSNVILTGEAG